MFKPRAARDARSVLTQRIPAQPSGGEVLRDELALLVRAVRRELVHWLMPAAFGAVGILIMRSSLREAFADALATSDVLVAAVFVALGWVALRYAAHVDKRFIEVERKLRELELKQQALRNAQKEAGIVHHSAR